MNRMDHLINSMQTVGLIASALVIGMTACAAVPEAPAAAPAGASASQETTQPKPVSAPSKPTTTGIRIEVSFKLDPRLSGGTYGGEHWVSPPTFTSAAQAGTETSVEARVRALDSRGAPVKVGSTWTTADPSMLSVAPMSPGETDHVQIIVKRVGQTRLVIAAAGATKELRVTATAVANGRGIQVDIAQ